MKVEPVQKTSYP